MSGKPSHVRPRTSISRASTCMTAGNLGCRAPPRPHERIDSTCRTPAQTRHCDSPAFRTADVAPPALDRDRIGGKTGSNRDPGRDGGPVRARQISVTNAFQGLCGAATTSVTWPTWFCDTGLAARGRQPAVANACRITELAVVTWRQHAAVVRGASANPAGPSSRGPYVSAAGPQRVDATRSPHRPEHHGSAWKRAGLRGASAVERREASVCRCRRR